MAHARRNSGDIADTSFAQVSYAALGFTTWDPALEITPVMQWLEETGWQFGYPKLAPYAHDFIPVEMQHLFTYASHISLPTDIARTYSFREDVTMYGWEDTEWGMRLRDNNIRLLYESDAKAHHHHRLTMEDSLRRMTMLGESAARLEKFFPHLGRVPKGRKLLTYQVLAFLPTMRGLHARAFLAGIDKARERCL